MRAGDDIGGESRAPAHHLAEIDRNKNEDPVRNELIDILKEEKCRDCRNDKADEPGCGQANRVLGSRQH